MDKGKGKRVTVEGKHVKDDGKRVKWTNDLIKCFLQACIEEVNKVGLRGLSLQKESWTTVGMNIKKLSGEDLTQKQLKNEYDALRGKYTAWLYLVNKTGNLYNPISNSFNLNDQEWDDFYKGHPKGKSMRTSPLLFPDLCQDLFGNTIVDGAIHWAPSSTNERSLPPSSQIEDVLSDDDVEDVDEDPFAEGSQPKENTPSNATPSQRKRPKENTTSQHERRPKKKGKTSSLNALYEDMSKALKVLTATEDAQQTTMVDACIEKLNALGLDQMDPVYMAAIDIFGQSTLLREMWVKVPSDPEFSKGWLTRTATRLGFL